MVETLGSELSRHFPCPQPSSGDLNFSQALGPQQRCLARRCLLLQTRPHSSCLRTVRLAWAPGLLGGALNRCVLSSNTPSLKGLRWLEEVPANGEGPLMGVRFLFEMVMVVEPYEYTKNVWIMWQNKAKTSLRQQKSFSVCGGGGDCWS